MPPRKRKARSGPLRLLSSGEMGTAAGISPEGARTSRRRGRRDALPPPDFVIGPGGPGTVYGWLPERAEEVRKQKQEKQELAIGQKARPCPVCGAHAGERCLTRFGKRAQSPHTARLREPGT
jgi:hypothetical protein